MSALDGSASPLNGVIARYRGNGKPSPDRRKPGRPLKRSPEYFRDLLTAHCAVKAWFVKECGCEPTSDRQLYTEYFAEQFKAEGERAGRASTPEFQRALKTLRNELAEARRLERTSPGNVAFSGTGESIKC